MSSIIEGYDYDIFISYRQKDNRGERCVSEFVESLKKELESTFKEDVSVYFDISPLKGYASPAWRWMRTVIYVRQVWSIFSG